MAKSKKKENTKEEKQFIFNLTLAGHNQEIRKDTILECLEHLALTLEPEQIKSRAWINIRYGNQEVQRMFFIPQFRRLLNNKITRVVTAKLFKSGLVD